MYRIRAGDALARASTGGAMATGTLATKPRCINKHFLVPSVGLRLAVLGRCWLAQAHHQHRCQEQAPPPPRPTVWARRLWPTPAPPAVHCATSVQTCCTPSVRTAVPLRTDLLYSLRTYTGPCRTLVPAVHCPSVHWSLPYRPAVHSVQHRPAVHSVQHRPATASDTDHRPATASDTGAGTDSCCPSYTVRCRTLLYIPAVSGRLS